MSSCRGYPVNFVHQPPSEVRLNDNQWLDVYCPHKDKGCKWIGPLRQLQNHFNQNLPPNELCQYQEIRCMLCQSHLCERRLLPYHVSNECRHRDIQCRYYHVGCKFKNQQQQISMEEHMREAMGDHLNLVTKSLSQKGSEIAELKRQHWMLILLILAAGGIFHAYTYQAESKVNNLEATVKELASEIAMLNHGQHLPKEGCNTFSTIVANFTNLNSEIQNLSHDTDQIWNNITQIMTTIEDTMVAVDKVKQSVKSIPSVKAKTDTIGKQVVSGNEELRKLIQTEKDTLTKSIDRTRKDLKNMEFHISTEEKKKELEDIKKQLENINSMVSLVCNSSSSSSAAKEFQKMKKEVQYISQQADFPVLPVSLNLTRVKERKDLGSPWFSMPFYTHKEGYKMRLVVNLDGKRSGAGTHISVAIYLMSGKYDAKLEWPLNITLNITLNNQLSKGKYTISRVYSTHSSSHNYDLTGRVWDDTMAKHGIIYPQFASHKIVFKATDLRSYIEHDSLHFKVSKVEHAHESEENSKWYKFW